MSRYPESMQTLIEEFSRMPGIGIRTAERLAFYVLSASPESMTRLSRALEKVNRTIRFCNRCFNLSEGDTCAICNDGRRDPHTLCVVEEPKDIISIEKSGVYHGLYHVLLGVLSPLDGIGPQDIKIQSLLARVKAENIKEVILATSSDTEGEATALYLIKVLKALKAKVTRLTQGIPVGSDLEFADRATLTRAMETRQEIKT